MSDRFACNSGHLRGCPVNDRIGHISITESYA
jgi:hypothetical protein